MVNSSLSTRTVSLWRRASARRLFLSSNRRLPSLGFSTRPQEDSVMARWKCVTVPATTSRRSSRVRHLTEGQARPVNAWAPLRVFERCGVSDPAAGAGLIGNQPEVSLAPVVAIPGEGEDVARNRPIAFTWAGKMLTTACLWRWNQERTHFFRYMIGSGDLSRKRTGG